MFYVGVGLIVGQEMYRSTQVYCQQAVDGELSVICNERADCVTFIQPRQRPIIRGQDNRTELGGREEKMKIYMAR